MIPMAALVVVAAVAGAPSLPPSIEDALLRHGPALVAVHARDGVRPGFFVSSSGVAVALLASADDVVIELQSGERRRARVLVKDDDGVALIEVVRLEKDTLFPSLGLADKARTPTTKEWLLGLGLADGRASPSLGGLRRVDELGRWRLDLPLDAGAPVMLGGRVVGVVVERAGTTSCVAVPADRIISLVKKLQQARE
jgi:hypothetical protein